MTTPQNQTISSLLAAAVTATQSGRLDDAESSCHEILSIDPEDPHGLHILGKILASRQDFDNAIKHLKTSARIFPDYNIFISLGMAQLQANSWEEAILSFEKAASFDPSQGLPIEGIRKSTEAGQQFDAGCAALARIGKTYPTAKSININYLQLRQLQADNTLNGGDTLKGARQFVQLVREANFIAPAFQGAASLASDHGIPDAVGAQFTGLDFIILLTIEAAGFQLNGAPNIAESKAFEAMNALGTHLADHPDDSEGWRLLGFLTSIFNDSNAGNGHLRALINELPNGGSPRFIYPAPT